MNVITNIVKAMDLRGVDPLTKLIAIYIAGKGSGGPGEPIRIDVKETAEWAGCSAEAVRERLPRISTIMVLDEKAPSLITVQVVG